MWWVHRLHFSWHENLLIAKIFILHRLRYQNGLIALFFLPLLILLTLIWLRILLFYHFFVWFVCLRFLMGRLLLVVLCCQCIEDWTTVGCSRNWFCLFDMIRSNIRLKRLQILLGRLWFLSWVECWYLFDVITWAAEGIVALTLVDITTLEFDLLRDMFVFIFALKVGFKLLILIYGIKACILLRLNVSKTSKLCSLPSV